VVVLAFDDYERVPKAKAITQSNRVKTKAPYEFGEAQQLPPTIPEKFNEKLANRIFKRRVIDFVCNRLVQHLTVSDSKISDNYTRSFVVDYTGCPILFEAGAGSATFEASRPRFMSEVPPMGEADIKFLRWGHYFSGNIIAFSVDGDFIPIALMHCEHQRRRAWEWRQQQGKQEQQDDKGEPPKEFEVALYRLKFRMPLPKRSTSAADPTQRTLVSKAAATASTAGKLNRMSLGMSLPHNASVGDDEPISSRGSTRREYEYVNIPVLYDALHERFAAMFPTYVRDPQHRWHYMRLLAVLIGLSGTDFSRGLPLVGPMTLWNMLHSDRSVFASLLEAYDPSRGLMRTRLACDTFASAIYLNKFSSHFKKACIAASAIGKISPSRRQICQNSDGSDTECDNEDDFEQYLAEQEKQSGLGSVLHSLSRSALSDKTKTTLPSTLRVLTTLRNINWILHYWSCRVPMPSQDPGTEGTLWNYEACYPDPINRRFGFAHRRNDRKHGSCAILWFDEAEELAKKERREAKKNKKSRKRSSSSSSSSGEMKAHKKRKDVAAARAADVVGDDSDDEKERADNGDQKDRDTE
jgi:hypothetical protein